MTSRGHEQAANSSRGERCINFLQKKGLGSRRDIIRLLMSLPILLETCASMTTASSKPDITQYHTKDKTVFAKKQRHIILNEEASQWTHSFKRRRLRRKKGPPFNISFMRIKCRTRAPTFRRTCETEY